MSRAGKFRELRIIGGRWRSRRVQFIDTPGLRPTPDRIRETLYNWLQFDLPGRHVLDLFAGSGALGFEALSRGAGSLTLLEYDAAQARCLREQAEKLAAENYQIIAGDSLRWLRQAQAPEAGYGLILLDPPFHQGLPNQLLALLAEKGWLSEGVWVYIESEQTAESLQLPKGMRLHRQAHAGLVQAMLFYVEGEGNDTTVDAGPTPGSVSGQLGC